MKNASQKRFADRISNHQLCYSEREPDDLPSDLYLYRKGLSDRHLIGRLCSDERMRRVWGLTADLPDDRFLAFMMVLLRIKAHGQQAVADREDSKKACQLIDDAQAALEQLTSILRRRDPYFWMWVPSFKQAEESDCLRRVQEGLDEQRVEILEGQARSGVTRKAATAARMMFMADAVRLMREVLGKPYYDAVAGLTSAVFNDEGDADPEAVRAAVRSNKRPRKEWLFEPLKYALNKPVGFSAAKINFE